MRSISAQHTPTRFSIDTSWRSAAEAIFTQLIVSRGVRAVKSDQWHVAGSLLTLPGTVAFHHAHSFGSDEWLLQFPSGGFVLIEHAGEIVRVRVAAGDDAEAQCILSQIRTAVPETAPPARSARVTFWMLGNRGSEAVPRDLAAPTWTEIAYNYPAATTSRLTPLFAETWRPNGGRLLLWHGDPGVGKSWCVRALMRAWQEWCSFHVILDPEKFFGSNAEYMVNVLLTPGDEEHDNTHLNGHGPHWRLLILEDTGELLSIDAKDRAGQGLSRLLNLCDGLLGQSLNVLVLITTNEDLGRMHPAVVRPGRCVSNVGFKRFDASEARHWLLNHGVLELERNIGAATLAELYAQLDGPVATDPQQSVGFLPS